MFLSSRFHLQDPEGVSCYCLAIIVVVSYSDLSDCKVILFFLQIVVSCGVGLGWFLVLLDVELMI